MRFRTLGLTLAAAAMGVTLYGASQKGTVEHKATVRCAAYTQTVAGSGSYEIPPTPTVHKGDGSYRVVKRVLQESNFRASAWTLQKDPNATNIRVLYKNTEITPETSKSMIASIAAQLPHMPENKSAYYSHKGELRLKLHRGKEANQLVFPKFEIKYDTVQRTTVPEKVETLTARTETPMPSYAYFALPAALGFVAVKSAYDRKDKISAAVSQLSQSDARKSLEEFGRSLHTHMAQVPARLQSLSSDASGYIKVMPRPALPTFTLPAWPKLRREPAKRQPVNVLDNPAIARLVNEAEQAAVQEALPDDIPEGWSEAKVADVPNAVNPSPVVAAPEQDREIIGDIGRVRELEPPKVEINPTTFDFIAYLQDRFPKPLPATYNTPEVRSARTYMQEHGALEALTDDYEAAKREVAIYTRQKDDIENLAFLRILKPDDRVQPYDPAKPMPLKQITTIKINADEYKFVTQ
jgi:hypothetical protein